MADLEHWSSDKVGTLCSLTSLTAVGRQMYFDLCLGGCTFCLRRVFLRAVRAGQEEEEEEEEEVSGHWR